MGIISVGGPQHTQASGVGSIGGHQKPKLGGLKKATGLMTDGGSHIDPAKSAKSGVTND